MLSNSRKWQAVVMGAALVVSTLAAGCGTANTTGNATNTTSNTANATSAGVPIPADPKYSGPVVATYTGGQLTKAELDHQYNLQIVLANAQSKEDKKTFLTYYVIWYKYVYGQAAKQKQPTANPTQAKQMADQAITQLSTTPPFKSKADVLNKMKELGLTEDDIVQFVEKGQFLQQYLQDRMKSIKVTDPMMQAYYNQHKGDFTKVTVDQILVDNLALAKQIEAKLKAGQDFGKLADQYSKDPSAKQNHGHLADMTTGSFVPEFANACNTLPIGQISDPVHTQYGYHVLRVDSRSVQSYNDARATIAQQLLPQMQSQKEQSMYQDALKGANIKVTAKAQDL